MTYHLSHGSLNSRRSVSLACLLFCSAYWMIHDRCAKPALSPRQEQSRTSGPPSSSSPSPRQIKHIAPSGITALTPCEVVFPTLLRVRLPSWSLIVRSRMTPGCCDANGCLQSPNRSYISFKQVQLFRLCKNSIVSRSLICQKSSPFVLKECIFTSPDFFLEHSSTNKAVCAANAASMTLVSRCDSSFSRRNASAFRRKSVPLKTRNATILSHTSLSL